MQYTDNLQTLVGHLKRRCPSKDSTLLIDFLNQRMRRLLDKRGFWSGTLKRGVISIPNEYTTGTVSLTTGSAAVTGSGTAWATADVVDTTVAAAVTSPGLHVVTPGSMSGITTDALLYVDGAGTPEIVSVRKVTATTFTANFSVAHGAAFTLKSSSLVGRQLRMGSTYPMFTIRAVPSATSLTLDAPWGGAALSGASYSILKLYYTLATDIRDILLVVDRSAPRKLRIHVPQTEVNYVDPQRTTTGEPEWVVDHIKAETGHMQYEIWPSQTSARQLDFLYAAQWPDMVAPGDQPPPFIDPTILIYGALADAYATKATGRSEMDKDPWYDPVQSNRYEVMFEREAQAASDADDGKALMAYEQSSSHLFGSGGSQGWYQRHDVSVDQIRQFYW